MNILYTSDSLPSPTWQNKAGFTVKTVAEGSAGAVLKMDNSFLDDALFLYQTVDLIQLDAFNLHYILLVILSRI